MFNPTQRNPQNSYKICSRLIFESNAPSNMPQVQKNEETAFNKTKEAFKASIINRGGLADAVESLPMAEERKLYQDTVDQLAAESAKTPGKPLQKEFIYNGETVTVVLNADRTTTEFIGGKEVNFLEMVMQKKTGQVQSSKIEKPTE